MWKLELLSSYFGNKRRLLHKENWGFAHAGQTSESALYACHKTLPGVLPLLLGLSKTWFSRLFAWQASAHLWSSVVAKISVWQKPGRSAQLASGSPPADSWGPGVPAPLPKIFFKIVVFRQNKGKPPDFEQSLGSGPTPRVKTLLGTKIPDPPLKPLVLHLRLEKNEVWLPWRPPWLQTSENTSFFWHFLKPGKTSWICMCDNNSTVLYGPVQWIPHFWIKTNSCCR